MKRPLAERIEKLGGQHLPHTSDHTLSIVENGEELGSLSAEQIRYLLDDCKLIYFCDECQQYHMNPDVQWINIDLALKGFPG